MIGHDMDGPQNFVHAGATAKPSMVSHATSSPARDQVDRDISRHSPSHTSKPVNFIPSSSCWQNLSHSFQPKSRHAKADALDSTPHQPSFLREAPDEILDIILLHSVRGHQDLHKLSLTCRRWRDFSCDDQPWKRLAVRAWGSRSDIVQVPIKKDAHCTVSWKEYYCNRIRSHLPELSYMMKQQNMTVSIRSILINWLLAVIDEFQQDDDDGVFYTGAHHQTVAILDHYCQKVSETLQTSDLQMIGAACAVLALHEGVPLSDIDMSYFKKASFYTDGACTADEVLHEAHKIAEVLNTTSVLAFGTASDFIDVLLTTMQKNYSSSSTYCLAHYLGELALQGECSLKYTPVIIGTSAYALACHTLGWAEGVWMPIIRSNANVKSISEIMECAGELQGLLRQALAMLTRRNRKMTLPHVVVKYSRREKQHVAKVIVTESAWPVICPHGCDRDAHEYCAECVRDEQQAGVVGDAAAEEGWEEEEEENVNPAESLNSSMSEEEEGEEEEELDEGVDGSPNVARPSAGEPGAVMNSATPREMCAADRHAAKTPTNAAVGMGGSGCSSEEEESEMLQGGAGGRCAPSSDGGGAMRSSSSGCVASTSDGPNGLQDVSFGAISESHDNSFANASFGAGGGVLDGSIVGGECDRRQSFGSVLGKVFEEEGEPSDARGGGSGGGGKSAVGGAPAASSCFDDIIETVRDADMLMVEAAVNDISIDHDCE